MSTVTDINKAKRKHVASMVSGVLTKVALSVLLWSWPVGFAWRLFRMGAGW